jgi:SAM-dependent methyltransferase
VDRAYTAVHIEEDRRHWYFRGRLAILLGVLERVLPARPVRLVELGCGTGNVLASLGRFGEAVGIELDAELREVGRSAGLDIRPGSLPDDIPVADGWADAALLFDVVEHLDDDLVSLRAAARLVRPGGLVIVTVPAYAWLWSGHDVALGHRRRYTAAGLRRVLASAGLEVERLGYFNTLLFPAIAGVRLLKRAGGGGGHDLHRPPALVNATLAKLFALERRFVLTPGLPFGTSVLAVARRPHGTALALSRP